MPDALIQVCSRMLEAGFDGFQERFHEVTRMGRDHFRRADFHAIQGDTKYRLSLYKDSVKRVAAWVSQAMGEKVYSEELWRSIRETYAVRVMEKPAFEIAQTYFNSVYRKIPLERHSFEVLFVKPQTHILQSEQPIFKRHWAVRPAEQIVRKILTDADLGADWEDLDRDIQRITVAVQKGILTRIEVNRSTRAEVLRSVFYRNKSAYVVGRLVSDEKIFPFVLPILHSEHGIFVDTLIDDENDVSILFSFTRSYFLVNSNIPSELVGFLKSILPQKNIGELYNSIGFNKHGKTEWYRDFTRHLELSTDLFVTAPGIKGMVMTVFTLPSFNFVFKLIKDKFEPPKNITKEEVKSKYRLVSQHDRVGRMADTHEFVDFVFPRSRFSEALLKELELDAPSIVQVQGDEVIIRHLYTERRMIPLNIYLENATIQEAESAVHEYGNAIRQLAAANVFPGDMLLKNFGVTRHQRVVFYDYDEITFLTDCHFRKIPEPRNEEEVMSGEVWYSVGPHDIFPEEFTRFLIGRKDIREIFFRLHGQLFEPSYWKYMQDRIRDGEILTVFPYRSEKRFDPDRVPL
jgi:isocitrate dehydrogenase kinase/phosphatase